MKYRFSVILAVLSLVFVSSVSLSAQTRPPVPRGSQKASVMQTIGTTDVSITYSRPAVKGRPIFADAPSAMASRAKGEATLDNSMERQKGEPIVPYGHLWRAGANEATLFVVNDDVLINGQPLAAGKYSLHMLPTKEEWTVVFNKDDGQWGSFDYDASKDALRVKAKPEWASTSEEMLTYTIDPAAPGADGSATSKATVFLRWEKVRVPFTVEVKDMVGATMTRLKSFVAGAKPEDPGPYLSAANYAKANKQADATKWFEEALKRNDAQIATKETFQNLNRKATILLNLDRKVEALTAAERAIVVGKADSTVPKASIEQLEKRIADIKAGKQ